MAKKNEEQKKIDAAAKRRQKNRDTLINWFGGEGATCTCPIVKNQERCSKHNQFIKRFKPEEVILLIKLFDRDRGAFEHIAHYAKRFKQAAHEIDVSDIEATLEVMAVAEIMMS